MLKFILILTTLIISACSNNKSEYSLLRGINYSHNNNYDLALIEYQKAYDSDKNNPIILNELGYTYYQFGNYSKAEEFWLKSLKLTPESIETIKNLATLYFYQEKYDKSLTILENIENKNDNFYIKMRGNIYYKMGKEKEAYTFFKKLTLNNFDCETYLIHLSLIKKFNNDDFYLAIKNGYNQFKNEKKYVIFYANTLSNEFQNFSEASTVLINYLLEHNNDEDILFTLSSIYSSAGDIQKAQAVLELK